MESKLFNGYTVFENGTIIGKFGKTLKPRKARGGYLRIVISNGVENQKQYSVHRLVAELFIPNPDNKPEVNHRDRNKENNHKDNLEWATRRENNIHAPSQKGRTGRLSVQSKSVIHKQTGIVYDSIKQAADTYGIEHKSLCASISRGSKNCQFTRL